MVLLPYISNKAFNSVVSIYITKHIRVLSSQQSYQDIGFLKLFIEPKSGQLVIKPSI